MAVRARTRVRLFPVALSGVARTDDGRRMAADLGPIFDRHRRRLTDVLIRVARAADCGVTVPPPEELDALDVRRAQFSTVVHLVGASAGTGNPLTRDLLIGWLKTQIESPSADRLTPYDPAALVERVRRPWLAELASELSPSAADTLQRFLQELALTLATQSRRRLRVLLVGDCFTWELSSSLVGPCARLGIDIECRLLNEKLPARLRNQIRGINPDVVDLVFFSPYTHTFLPSYAAATERTAALWNRTQFFQALDQAAEEAFAITQTLLETLHCPVYLHNTASALQTFGRPADRIKFLLCARNRKRAAAYLHEQTGRQIHALANQRLRLVDEFSFLGRTSRWALGANCFEGVLLHPTCLGIGLIQNVYVEAVFVTACLATKKVVVCDLDNTLWHGAIGEGAVAHFADRHHVLKRLRQKGVLLSINSKNDPKNVTFEGSVLVREDFVAARINWRPKPDNLAEIVEELNIKPQDFVFIDDRPDERERVQEAFPDMVVLDASQAATWRFIGHWEQHLQASTGDDRTKLYHDKRARQSFLSRRNAMEDESAALAKLKLEVRIEAVGQSQISRVVELINRTNQFNLNGARTSVQELGKGLGVTHHVFQAIASDKFGKMGVVGAMRAEVAEGRVSVPVFVLSCRVFGFGIEYVLLNTVRRLSGPNCVLTGEYRETANNGPCREFYARSGLRWNGVAWEGDPANLPDDPSWLTVERAV